MTLWPYESPGIPNQLFLKNDSPLTREEIRVIVINKLWLRKSDCFLDIGAGTGSVAIEACRIATGGEVYAVEAIPERAALITENSKRFGVNNLKVLTGAAPEILNELPLLDRVFIGGSNGKLSGIIEGLTHKIKPNGRLVMTAVTIETLQTAIEILSKPPFHEFEALAVNLSALKMLQGYHLFQPEHDIYILAASI